MPVPDHVQQAFDRMKNQPPEPKVEPGWQSDWDDWHDELVEQAKWAQKMPPLEQKQQKQPKK